MERKDNENKEKKEYVKDPTCPLLSHKLPSDVNEIAYVIAKVHKYGNIDDYAEKLIREDIERIRNSSSNNDDEDSFKKYIESILPSDSTTNTNNNIEKIHVTLRLKKTIAYVGKLIAKHYDEDFDTFVSTEISKIISSIAGDSTTLLGPSISVELSQHIEKLQLEEEQEGGKEDLK